MRNAKIDVSKDTALVVEGGGAKGAFAAGALRILQQRGFRFCASSGASAGALNVVSVSTNQINEAVEAWEGLTVVKLLSGSEKDQRLDLGSLYIAMFNITIVIVNLIGQSFSHRTGFMKDFNWPVNVYGGIFAIINATLVFQFGISVGANYGYCAAGAIFGVVILFMSYNAPRQHKIMALSVYLAIPLFFLQSILHEGVRDIAYFLCWGMLSTVFGFIFIETPSLLGSAIGRAHLNKVLAQFLNKNISNRCIVAISKMEPVLEENNGKLVSDMRPHPWLSRPTSYNLKLTYKHIAAYRDLQELESCQAIKILIASAALPLGICQPMAIDNSSYQDGGLGDNCPIFPLLERTNIEQIVVILLRPIDDAEHLYFGSEEWQSAARKQVKKLLVRTIDNKISHEVYKSLVDKYNMTHGDDIAPGDKVADIRKMIVEKDIIQFREKIKEKYKVYLDRFDGINLLVIGPHQGMGRIVDTFTFFSGPIRRFIQQGMSDAATVLDRNGFSEPILRKI